MLLDYASETGISVAFSHFSRFCSPRDSSIRAPTLAPMFAPTLAPSGPPTAPILAPRLAPVKVAQLSVRSMYAYWCSSTRILFSTNLASIVDGDSAVGACGQAPVVTSRRSVAQASDETVLHAGS